MCKRIAWPRDRERSKSSGDNQILVGLRAAKNTRAVYVLIEQNVEFFGRHGKLGRRDRLSETIELG